MLTESASKWWRMSQSTSLRSDCVKPPKGLERPLGIAEMLDIFHERCKNPRTDSRAIPGLLKMDGASALEIQ